MHDGISIHAAREGGDDGALMTVVQRGISIHAAREGGDCKLGTFGQNAPIFQSTPPVKAATNFDACYLGCSGFQSTPPVKAATHRCKS